MLEVLTESLSIRRDGMAFIADAVANPVNLQNASVQAEIDELSRKMNDVNARLGEASTRFFKDNGFEQRADGPFVIEC